MNVIEIFNIIRCNITFYVHNIKPIKPQTIHLKYFITTFRLLYSVTMYSIDKQKYHALPPLL